MKFVFFGTRELAVKVLKRLLNAGYSPSLVVTGPDKLAGRKQELTSSPVKEVALKHNLPIAQPEKLSFTKFDSNLVSLSLKPDLFVVAAYGNIIPKEILEIPRHGTLNVHPSLLPKYRGPAPERFALLKGEKITGVTIILLDEKVDHGPILAQEEFVIPEDMKHEELHQKLGEIGGELLVKTIPLWVKGEIEPKEQDHLKATFTKKIIKEDGRIDWSKEAEYIARQIRAFYPWPGTWTLWDGKILKILKGRAEAIPKEHSSLISGTTIPWQEGFGVVTGKGVLAVQQLQMEGKNPVSAKDFLLGHKDFLSIVFK
jgi:methionyl-tRNA formyltransferase